MSPTAVTVVAPEVEVVATVKRRQFSMEYKRRIVREADGCKRAGAIGALLRREGLYSSHLAAWRAARERGELATAAKKRGPVPQVPDPRDKKIAGLPHPPGRPAEVWINPPKPRATEEPRGFAPARGGVLDHASLGRLISAYRSDLRRPSCLEAPA